MDHVCNTHSRTCRLQPADSRPGEPVSTEAGPAVRGPALVSSVVAALILVSLLGTAAVTGLAPTTHNDVVVPAGEAPYAGLVNPQAVLHETSAVPLAQAVPIAPIAPVGSGASADSAASAESAASAATAPAGTTAGPAPAQESPAAAAETR